jgi:hypothetical protein
VVCLQENVPEEGVKAERGWRCLKVDGAFAFTVSGIHASLAVPLASIDCKRFLDHLRAGH